MADTDTVETSVFNKLLGSSLDGLDEASHPPVFEFAKGEAVEVLHGIGMVLWGGGWQRAVIEEVSPSNNMRNFSYTCRLLADDGNTLVRKRAEQIRRRSQDIVIAHHDFFLSQQLSRKEAVQDQQKQKEALARHHQEQAGNDLGGGSQDEATGATPTNEGAHDESDDDGSGRAEAAVEPEAERLSEASRTELLEMRAAAVLTPSHAHLLMGFSFHFGQYWQYKSAQRQTSWTSQHPLSIDVLTHGYAPLGWALSALCEAPSQSSLICSRAIARRRLAAIRPRSYRPYCAPPLCWHAPATRRGRVGADWVAAYHCCGASCAPHARGALCWLATNLLRHVDTPLTSLRATSTLATYALTPSLCSTSWSTSRSRPWIKPRQYGIHTATQCAKHPGGGEFEGEQR